jgi:photosystem II stability/assembly factor-like uncharacterized protein
MRYRTLPLFTLFVSGVTLAQDPPAAPTTPPTAAMIANLPARNLGPTTMGGRINAIAVYEKEPRIFYIGTASGGLWKTDNGGITTSPVFFKEATVAIGAVAVGPNNPNLVYVGTGEHPSRNSTSWGDGIYKSTDGGKTWSNVGLKECRHFSHIIVDPRNENVVYAAGMGDLWGYNQDRGIYKSTDGGKTWAKILYVSEKTGFADMVMDPKNPNTILVSAWDKLRKAYDWTSGGPGSGIYKTTNGGKSWKKVTKGLPQKGFFGRIGLDYFRSNPKVVVASIEHRDGDSRAGSGFYRSEDGGESWKFMSSTNPRPFYFSNPKQDPLDVNRVYMAAVNMHVSDDKGERFRVMPTSVHVDHHAMWINPTDSNHIIIGQDGGIAQTRDRGMRWEHVNSMPIGQFYAVSFDFRKPYWVFGGLQDNGSWASPTQTDMGGVAFFHAFTYNGGDGFHTANDPEDWTTAYSESQGGFLNRTDLLNGGARGIRPGPNNTDGLTQGERLRWNWSSPILISPHNSKTIYFAGNRLFKSVNRGDRWRAISPDLSTNDPTKLSPGKNSATPEDTGAERHCTIITISESARKQGVLWVGTDDGQVQVSQDDGDNWTNVTANIPDLPANTWVSRVIASNHETGRAFATFDGHRNNDYNTYVYMTDDFGKTWMKITGNLPANEPCYVVREGIRNPDLLVLGTEFGMWFSLDRGKSWAKYTAGDWPTIRIDDLVMHPRDGDIIVGTHGRSIWIVPYSGLEAMTATAMAQDVVLAKPSPIYLMPMVNGRQWDGDRVYYSPNSQPGTTVFYYLRTEAKEEPTITISDVEGRVIVESKVSKSAGLNSWNFNAARSRGRLEVGNLRVTLKVDGKEYINSVKVDQTDALAKGK